MTPKEERYEQIQKQAELAFNTQVCRGAFISGAQWADHTAPKAAKKMELDLLRKQLIDIASRLEFLYGIKLSHASFDYRDGSVAGIRFIYSEWDMCEYKRVSEE